MTTTFVPSLEKSCAIANPIPLQPPEINTISWLLTNVKSLFQLFVTYWESLLFTIRIKFTPRRTLRAWMKREDVSAGKARDGMIDWSLSG